MTGKVIMKRVIIFMWLFGITAGLLLNWAAAYASAKARLDITVTGISDGDSIRAERLKLRLHGIDAPERRQKCTDAAGKTYACGKQAKNWLQKQIKTGDRLSCDLLEIDRYRRLIVRCFKDGRDVNEAMVRAGWAVAYTRYSDDYLTAEAAAKTEQIGLWQGPFIHPEFWRRKKQ